MSYSLYYFFTDGVRLREERRRDGPSTQLLPAASPQPQQQQQQQRSLTSRRSSTDSSEEGFNLNVRDLKVRNCSPYNTVLLIEVQKIL